LNKVDITPAVAGRLVGAQFPQWSDLPIVPVKTDGWDNTTFRLGDELSIRLPSADRYVPQVEKEHRWLPVLARHLSVRIPEPVAKGRPSDEFPRPWSIYRWIEGDTVNPGETKGLTTLASELAQFLRELHSIGPADGPPPGEHNFFRGGPVSSYEKDTLASIRFLADEIDAEGAAEAWQAAVASSYADAPVWVHGDVAPSNLISVDGRLHGVIDFGCSAVGDPSCDLVMAWTFFTDESRETFRAGLRLDEGYWRRARGWALWKALITLAKEKHGVAGASNHTWGWRIGCRAVIGLVIAEHRSRSAR
jgi:aminoglycoside phosphotransferase (APT) family kinase protein